MICKPDFYYIGLFISEVINLLISINYIILLAIFIVKESDSERLSDFRKIFITIKNLSEGSPGCTGPKKENVLGNIFCRSENTAPCKDMYGCN